MAGTVKNGPTWKQYTSNAKEKTAQVKATPGTVRKVHVHSVNAAVQYVQLHNAIVPVSASIQAVRAVPASGNGELDFGDGWFCDTAVTVALSTAQDTYAAPGADDGMFAVQFL